MRFWHDIDRFFSGFMPPVTRRIFYILVGVHFGLWLLSGAGLRGPLFELLALSPSAVLPGFYLWQLVTHAFVHADFGHLFGNCLALLFFAGAIEQILGERRYLQMLLLAIVAGGISHIVLHFGETIPYSVGFSSAVYAILAACLVFIPNHTVYLNFLFPVKMKWLVIVYLGLEIYHIVAGSTGNVGHWAHVAGAAAGFAFIFYPMWKNRSRGRRPPGRRRGKVVRSRPLSMGHPGRSSRASDLYDDPHWKMDQ